MAQPPEDAQTQMLYAIAVEAYKLRVTVQWAIWAAVLVCLGVVFWVSLAIVA